MLTNYAQTELADYSYIMVEGFRASVNAKSILQAIDTLLNLNVKSSRLDIVSWARLISRGVTEKQTDVFIVVHNIDGTGLR